MEKHSSYHIQTDGFQHVLIGIVHMAQTVLLDRKCRVVIDYDPALSVKYLMKDETAFTCSSLKESIDSKTCFLAKDIP